MEAEEAAMAERERAVASAEARAEALLSQATDDARRQQRELDAERDLLRRQMTALE